jgi:regulator of cell morphogenesis and NO signaling
MRENLTTPETTLDPTWSVNDVIRIFPETITVFNELGVDTCCGGETALETAAVESGVEIDTMIAALVTAIEEERAGR